MMQRKTTSTSGIRSKLIRLVTKILLSSLIIFLILNIGLEVFNAKNASTRIQNAVRKNLISKGLILTSNNSRVLRGLAGDNAFLAISDLVTATVGEDTDIIYGIYMDNEKRPWIIAGGIHAEHIPGNALDDSTTSWAATVEKPSWVSMRLAKNELLEFAAPVISEGDRLGTIRYGLTTESMQNELTAATKATLKSLIASTAISCFLALFILFLGVRAARKQAGALTTPLEHLTQSAETISAGDFAKTITVVTNDEIGKLAQTLDSMREKIKHSTEELELRVDERTRALSDANIQLETEVVERREIEKDLVAAKDAADAANKAKSEFLATMSHEIRTPMNGVIGMNKLLLTTDLSTEQQEYAETIKFSAESLLMIINHILDFSKVEAGKIDIESVGFSVSKLISGVVNIISPTANGKNLKLTSHVEKSLPDNLVGDPTRLRQILLNFCSNAVKFTETGGISITTELVKKEAGEVELKFKVTDTGIGIPTEKMQKIFESFSQADNSTTRKYGGTGLGLAICKRLAEIMGGAIGVESVVGESSTFWFTAVLKIGTQAKSGSTANEPKNQKVTVVMPEALTNMRVLVAEDNLINQKIVSKILKKVGFKVELANNGRIAVDMVQQSKFDLVLMDVQMPELDGLGATREIRTLEEKSGGHICIIAFTANAMTGDKEKCLEAGMDGYVSKPINLDDMLATIARLKNEEV